jgi:dynein heavy chain
VLRLQVWIISKHYGDDARMGGLFERIAVEIGGRVERAVDLAQVFKMPAAQAVALIGTAKAVAEQWYTTYMQVGGADGGQGRYTACRAACAPPGPR